jgi:PAS domain S-box-containing protein
MTEPEQPETVNILVVDDDPQSLSNIFATLDRPDYRIVTASSGEEGLQKTVQQEFAVVVLDVLMPGMDGFETARILRLRRATRSLPIIFLSVTAAKMELVHQGYSVGAVDYLQKPIDADILKAKVAVFVDLFRMTRQIQRLREAEALHSAAMLRASESLYEATFNDAAVGIAHSSTDGRWLRVNPRLREILGYSEGELLQRRLQDVVRADEVPGVLDMFEQLLQGDARVHRRELCLAHREGLQLWGNLAVSLVHTAEGRPRCFLVVLEDVTERRRSEGRQRFLAGASEILLSSLDYRATLGAVVKLAVPAIADACLVAITPPEAEEKDQIVLSQGEPGRLEELRELHSLLAAQDESRLPQLASPRLLRQLGRASFAPGATLSDGAWALIQSLRVESAMIAPMVTRGRLIGSVAFFSTDLARHYDRADLGMATDLAQRVAFAVDNAYLYQQAQDAIGARDEFLSVASHELRTPLTPLVLQIQRLVSDKGGDPLDSIPRERLRQILQRTFSQTQRLARLVETLLDVSRIAANRLDLDRELLGLNELLHEIAQRFSEEATRVGSSLTVRPGEQVTGYWDRIRLEQVFTNLVDNALKYGGAAPVEIAIEVKDRRALVQVKDQGIGIEPSKLAAVFDRFERAVPSHSYGGLGLGLYIARRIVEAHHGLISVRSQPGSGSVFTVELPLDGEASSDGQEEIRITPLVEGEGVTASIRLDSRGG